MRIIWSLLALVIISACSDTEPKSGTNDDPASMTGDEDDDIPGPWNKDKPFEVSYDEQSLETMSQILKIANKYWWGAYYYRRVADYAQYEAIDYLEFKQTDGNVGTGKFTLYHVGPEIDPDNFELISKNYSIYFDFYIVENKIFCKSRESYPFYTFARENYFTFEYKDGRLYISAPFCHDMVLGKDKKIRSDVNGIIINDSEEVKNKLKKVWLHENGRNIIDLSYRQLIQLNANSPNGYNTFTTIDFFLYYYSTYRLELCTYGARMYCWTIKEISDTKLVLRGFMDDFDDVYYAVPRESVPYLLWDKNPKREDGWDVGGGKIGANF